MDADARFLDCPAYVNRHGTERCGLPAAVEDRYLLSSLDGPLDSVRIRCPRGHWFNGPVDSLTWLQAPAAAGEAPALAAGTVLRAR